MSFINCGVLSKYQYVLAKDAWPKYVMRASMWLATAPLLSGDVSRERTAKL
jgi:hypothetical protein